MIAVRTAERIASSISESYGAFRKPLRIVADGYFTTPSRILVAIRIHLSIKGPPPHRGAFADLAGLKSCFSFPTSPVACVGSRRS